MSKDAKKRARPHIKQQIAVAADGSVREQSEKRSKQMESDSKTGDRVDSSGNELMRYKMVKKVAESVDHL